MATYCIQSRRHFASKCQIRHIARASRWQPIVFSLAAILAVSVMHSSSCVITRDQHGKLRTRKH
jgi:hypothetical protein